MATQYRTGRDKLQSIAHETLLPDFSPPSSPTSLKIAAVLEVEPQVLFGHAESSALLKLDKSRHIDAVVVIEAAISRTGRRIHSRPKAKLIVHLYESGSKMTESEALRLLDLVE